MVEFCEFDAFCLIEVANRARFPALFEFFDVVDRHLRRDADVLPNCLNANRFQIEFRDAGEHEFALSRAKFRPAFAFDFLLILERHDVALRNVGIGVCLVRQLRLL